MALGAGFGLAGAPLLAGDMLGGLLSIVPMVLEGRKLGAPPKPGGAETTVRSSPSSSG